MTYRTADFTSVVGTIITRENKSYSVGKLRPCRSRSKPVRNGTSAEEFASTFPQKEIVFMYYINTFRNAAQQQRAPAHQLQQRQQQQQHPPHPHRLWSQKPTYQTLCCALTLLSASRLSRNPAQTRLQHRCRLCVAASASQQPTSPTQKQQQQSSKQQQQQQGSSKPSSNEADGWDSEDEYEDDDEYEYLDEGDEGWEDEDEWEDEEAEADEPLAPAVRQIPQEQTAVDFTQVRPAGGLLYHCKRITQHLPWTP